MTCVQPRTGSVWIYCRCPVHAPQAARLRKLGKAGLVGVRGREQAWQRVVKWRAAGYTPRTVQAMTGLAVATVRRLYEGVDDGAPVRMVQTTVTAIIGAPAFPVRGGWIASTGAARRLRALAFMGWSAEALTRQGIPRKTTQTLRRDVHPMVSMQTHRKVCEVYDRLWSSRGPSPRAAASAARLHWPGPLAWDDDTIDDPAAQPWAEKRHRRRTSEETAIEVEDVLELHPHWTSSRIAERLRYSDQTGVQNALERAGRRDLLDRLAANALTHDYRTA